MADASSGEDEDFRPGTESDDDGQSWNGSGASQDGGGDGAGGGSGDDGSDDNGSEGGIASDAADAGSESDGGGDATESGGGAGGGGGAHHQPGRNGAGRQHGPSPQRTHVRSARDAPVAAVRTRGGVGVQDSKGDEAGDEAGSDGDGDGDDGDADMSGGESSVSEQPTPPRPRADLRATEEDEVSDLDDEDEDDGSGHEGPDNRRSQYFPLGQIPQAAIAGVAAVVGRAQVYHDQTYMWCASLVASSHLIVRPRSGEQHLVSATHTVVEAVEQAFAYLTHKTLPERLRDDGDDSSGDSEPSSGNPSKEGETDTGTATGPSAAGATPATALSVPIQGTDGGTAAAATVSEAKQTEAMDAAAAAAAAAQAVATSAAPADSAQAQVAASAGAGTGAGAGGAGAGAGAGGAGAGASRSAADAEHKARTAASLSAAVHLFDHETKLFAARLALPLVVMIMSEPVVDAAQQLQDHTFLIGRLYAIASFALADPELGDSVQASLRQSFDVVYKSNAVFRAQHLNEVSVVSRVITPFVEVRGFERMLETVSLAKNKLTRCADVCQAFTILTRTKGAPIAGSPRLRTLGMRLLEVMRDMAQNTVTDEEFRALGGAYTDWLLNQVLAVLEHVMELSYNFSQLSEHIFRVRLHMVGRGLRSKFMGQRLAAIRDANRLTKYVYDWQDEMRTREPHMRAWLSHERVAEYALKDGWLEELFGARLHQEMITRSGSLITSMIRAKQFTPAMLRSIWDVAEGQHEQVVAAIYNTLADGVCQMHGTSAGVIKELLQCMRSKFVVDMYQPAPEAITLLDRVCAKATEFGWPADLRQALVELLLDMYMCMSSKCDTAAGQIRRLLCRNLPSKEELVRVVRRTLDNVQRRLHPHRSLELLKPLLQASIPSPAAIPGDMDSTTTLDLCALDTELGIVATIMADIMPSTGGAATAATNGEARWLPFAERLEVLRVLLRKPEIVLERPHVDALWTAYVEKRPQHTDRLCEWLANAAGWRGPYGAEAQTFCAFDDDINEHLLNDKLCQLDLGDFSEPKLRAFRCLFLRINQRRGNIHLSSPRQSRSRVMRVVKSELAFMERVWQLVFRGDEDVANGVLRLVVTLLLKSDIPVRDWLLQLVFTKLRQASDPTARLRLLSLLWQYFEHFADAVGTLRMHRQHAEATRVAISTRYVDLRPTQAPDGKRTAAVTPFKRRRVTAPDSTGGGSSIAANVARRRRSQRRNVSAASACSCIVASMCSHDRIRALRAAVARDVQCRLGQVVLTMPNNTQDSDPLSKHDLADGSTAACSVTARPADGDGAGSGATSNGAVAGDNERTSATAVVADRADFLDTLFALAADPDTDVSSDAWLLLQALPTSMAELQSCSDPGACVPQLDCAPSPRDVYRLQAACCFLLPPADASRLVVTALHGVPPAAGGGGGDDATAAAERVSWLQRFRDSGAIQRALRHVSDFNLAEAAKRSPETSSWHVRRFVACVRLAYCYLVQEPLSAALLLKSNQGARTASPPPPGAQDQAGAGGSDTPPIVGPMPPPPVVASPPRRAMVRFVSGGPLVSADGDTVTGGAVGGVLAPTPVQVVVPPEEGTDVVDTDMDKRAGPPTPRGDAPTTQQSPRKGKRKAPSSPDPAVDDAEASGPAAKAKGDATDGPAVVPSDDACVKQVASDDAATKAVAGADNAPAAAPIALPSAVSLLQDNQVSFLARQMAAHIIAATSVRMPATLDRDEDDCALHTDLSRVADDCVCILVALARERAALVEPCVQGLVRHVVENVLGSALPSRFCLLASKLLQHLMASCDGLPGLVLKACLTKLPTLPSRGQTTHFFQVLTEALRAQAPTGSGDVTGGDTASDAMHADVVATIGLLVTQLTRLARAIAGGGVSITPVNASVSGGGSDDDSDDEDTGASHLVNGLLTALDAALSLGQPSQELSSRIIDLVVTRGVFSLQSPLCDNAAARVLAFNIVSRLCNLDTKRGAAHAAAPATDGDAATGAGAGAGAGAGPPSPVTLSAPLRAAVATVVQAHRCATGALKQSASGLGMGIQWCHTDMQRSPVGYVGLKNPGMTCYQNSVLQQLFMIPGLRQAVLQAPPMRESVRTGRHGEQLVELRRQYQRLQVFNSVTHRRAYDPCDFVGACDDKPRGFFPLDSPVRSQNDANEFFSLLLDRLGSAFGPPKALQAGEAASESTGTDGKPKDIFECQFGGNLVHQLLGRGGGCKHMSTRKEPFTCVSLEIEKKPTLAKSLESFIQGEMLSGDNAYKCAKCDKKVDTLKRCCFHSLPPTLVVHLKRFGLNFETFTKHKINTLCQFPMELDLWPYTDQYLDAQAAEAAQEAASEAKTTDGATGGSGGGSGGSGGAQGDGDGGGVGASDSDDAGSGASKKLTREDCLYELKGVLIHSGTADFGHYFSIIRERSGQRRWLTFNDESVYEFSQDQMEEWCFGGLATRRGKNGTSRRTMRERNAFMLFYDRVTPEAARDMPPPAVPRDFSMASVSRTNSAGSPPRPPRRGSMSESATGTGASPFKRRARLASIDETGSGSGSGSGSGVGAAAGAASTVAKEAQNGGAAPTSQVVAVAPTTPEQMRTWVSDEAKALLAEAERDNRDLAQLKRHFDASYCHFVVKLTSYFADACEDLPECGATDEFWQALAAFVPVALNHFVLVGLRLPRTANVPRITPPLRNLLERMSLRLAPQPVPPLWRAAVNAAVNAFLALCLERHGRMMSFCLLTADLHVTRWDFSHILSSVLLECAFITESSPPEFDDPLDAVEQPPPTPTASGAGAAATSSTSMAASAASTAAASAHASATAAAAANFIAELSSRSNGASGGRKRPRDDDGGAGGEASTGRKQARTGAAPDEAGNTDNPALQALIQRRVKHLVERLGAQLGSDAASGDDESGTESASEAGEAEQKGEVEGPAPADGDSGSVSGSGSDVEEPNGDMNVAADAVVRALMGGQLGFSGGRQRSAAGGDLAVRGPHIPQVLSDPVSAVVAKLVSLLSRANSQFSFQWHALLELISRLVRDSASLACEFHAYDLAGHLTHMFAGVHANTHVYGPVHSEVGAGVLRDWAPVLKALAAIVCASDLDMMLLRGGNAQLAGQHLPSNPSALHRGEVPPLSLRVQRMLSDADTVKALVSRDTHDKPSALEPRSHIIDAMSWNYAEFSEHVVTAISDAVWASDVIYRCSLLDTLVSIVISSLQLKDMLYGRRAAVLARQMLAPLKAPTASRHVQLEAARVLTYCINLTKQQLCEPSTWADLRQVALDAAATLRKYAHTDAQRHLPTAAQCGSYASTFEAAVGGVAVAPVVVHPNEAGSGDAGDADAVDGDTTSSGGSDSRGERVKPAAVASVVVPRDDAAGEQVAEGAPILQSPGTPALPDTDVVGCPPPDPPRRFVSGQSTGSGDWQQQEQQQPLPTGQVDDTPSADTEGDGDGDGQGESMSA